MRVIDTSAWIEYLLDSALGRRIAHEIPAPAKCIVPTIVQMELGKWLAREITETMAQPILAYTMECVVAPLDTPTALLASELANLHRLATADAVIYATALARDAELLTCDAHFKDLPSVIHFAKGGE
jgi:predicted nucleic acid-binding protein